MTYTKEEARIKIQKLVEDFHAHEATLEKAAEAQIENNFIRPLFRYLNWNTENEGLSHAHYEFKVQVTNKKGLRPDYILNVDGRDVLVMDAKQVKYSMRDPRWLYQVYSYAYSTQNSKPSAKMDFAILTDFQEFIVLDCTLFAAKPEAVNNFRVLDWTYKDYVEKFDELWELLERNNVLNDSRPHVVARSGAPKQSPTDEGIASGQSAPLATTSRGLWSRYLSPQKVKANRIPPDKAFLAEMDDEKTGWRVLLAKDMKKRNPSADGELITAAVQLLIDRLIFIKALSDREVDKDYLGELAKVVAENGLADHDTGWFKACKTIFDELNNFYNGSIFQERRELENVTVSNKVVRSVITDLQPENSPYNFAVLPVEILGTIYERFLGRVVRTTDKRVTIEDKPEVRKAGGVYYTPQYIVDYIVENTLGKLLDPTPNPSPNEEHIRGGGLTPADVAKIKILDPACGSGSFLLGAYSKLIDWHKDYFERAGKEKRDRESFYKDESGQIRLTAKLKRDILKNNLFGVDIDPQAVEVTRFSLSLKALEDLREGELTEERSLFHQTVLPDLSANIKNGNSLIGNNYSLIPMERVEAKAFDWNSEFKGIMDDGGFDCVIGNPPWGAELDSASQKYFHSNFEVGKTSTLDTYSLFIEKSMQHLKENGLLGYITPDTFLRKDELINTRKFLLENTSIVELIESGPVFSQVRDTWCLILTVQRKKPTDNKIRHKKISRFITGAEERLEIFGASNWTSSTEVHQSIWLNHPKLIVGYRSTEQEQKIIEKIEKHASIGEQNNLYKISRGEEGSKFAIKTDDNGKYFMVIPKDVERYSVDSGSRISEETLTATKKVSLYSHPKIWIIRIQKMRWQQRVVCSFDSRNNSAGMKTLQIIVSPNDNENDLKYLSAILSSKLINFWCVNYLADDLNQSYLERIPIRAIDFANPAEKSRHDKMVLLVTQMLELHKSKAGAKTQSEGDVYERQIKSVDEGIDELVYELYGLTEEEVKIVEGG